MAQVGIVMGSDSGYAGYGKGRQTSWISLE